MRPLLLLVAAHFHLSAADLTSRDKHKTVVLARHLAMYLSRSYLKCSFPEIGKAFDGRDHTTIMSAVRAIEARREHDAAVQQHLSTLEGKLADGLGSGSPGASEAP